MSKSPKLFELILVDPQEGLCEEWSHSFAKFPLVSIVNGYFEEIHDYDCLVSPANSFGLMDGGVDLAIRNFFGMKIQYNVQKVIQREFYGEQPIGTSVLVRTENEDHPYLAHTPTMRVPADISNTDNVYNAFFALLRTIANHNKKKANFQIEKVLCPGLGTATGRMDFKEAARQMAVAYKNFLNPTINLTWPNLLQRNDHILGLSG